MNKSVVWGCVLAIAFFLLGVVVGGRQSKKERYKGEKQLTQIDTVVSLDTIYVNKPVVHQVSKLEKVVDTLIYTVVKNDTIEVPVSLPLVQKVYRDSTYSAVVSGVDFDDYPKLENIQLYNKNTVIYETHTIIKRKRWNWNIGVQIGAGYGFQSEKISPYIGIGIGYGFSF